MDEPSLLMETGKPTAWNKDHEPSKMRSAISKFIPPKFWDSAYFMTQQVFSSQAEPGVQEFPDFYGNSYDNEISNFKHSTGPHKY